MPYPAVFLIHSATLHHNNGNKQALAFSAPTGTATAGQTVTGGTSHATAVIDTVASPMVVKTVVGTFTPGETISTATWSATLTMQDDYFDSNGLTVPDVTDATVSCRFSNPQEAMRVGSRSVPYIVSTPKVVLPAGTNVREGDTLTSTETGFTGTFTINAVKQTYEAATKTVSHITCDIAAAGATGGV